MCWSQEGSKTSLGFMRKKEAFLAIQTDKNDNNYMYLKWNKGLGNLRTVDLFRPSLTQVHAKWGIMLEQYQWGSFFIWPSGP